MIINYLEKLFVTNDAATVIKELEVSSVYHPVLFLSLLCLIYSNFFVSEGLI